MTQDEIIRMAREAAHPFHLESELAIAWWRDKFLPKFADLVAAHEREKNLQVAFDTVVAEVLAEREACAKVCGQLMTPWDENTPNGELIALRNDGMRQCAAAIRARGEK